MDRSNSQRQPSYPGNVLFFTKAFGLRQNSAIQMMRYGDRNSCFVWRAALSLGLLASLLSNRPRFAQSHTASFNVADRGAVSRVTTGASPALGVGSASIQLSGGVPEGLALFDVRQSAGLISEVAVPAANLVNAGRIYAEVGGG